MKRRRLVWKGGVDGLDSKLYLFILDSRQLEAAVGSNELVISCHVLGSVDAMLRFIHAVGLPKLAVLVPVHACTQLSVSSRPRVPSYAIGKDRGEE